MARKAPIGITGLETAFSVCHGVLVRSGKIKLPKLVKLMSTRPAELLGLDAGTLKPGTPADFVLIDENEEYVYSNPPSAEKCTLKWQNVPIAIRETTTPT